MYTVEIAIRIALLENTGLDESAIKSVQAAVADLTGPIDMVLHCPKCGMQHIDEADSNGWDNPQHRSHLCHGCAHVWRPADVATNGVGVVLTTGKKDSPLHVRGEPSAWIIDRFGSPPTITHYKTVADAQCKRADVRVTPYYP